MAKLSVAPYGFHEAPSQPQNSQSSQNSESSPKSQKSSVSRSSSRSKQKVKQEEAKVKAKATEKLRSSEKSKKKEMVCQGDCELKYKKIKLENSRLTKNVVELKKEISEREHTIKDLREKLDEFEKSAEKKLAVPQADFDRRLCEIESALSQGLSCTLKTLQSIRKGEEKTTVEDVPVPKLIENAPHERNDKIDKFEERLALPVAPSDDLNNKDIEFDSLDMDFDLDIPIEDTYSEGIHPEVHDTTSANLAISYPEEHEREEFLENLTKEKTPIVSNIAESKSDNLENSSSKTAQIVEDDFDDITFFLRPSSAKKKFMSSNDKLRKAMLVKKEKKEVKQSESSSIKSPVKEKSKAKAGAKRKLQQDENASVVVKREHVKRRRPLTPVTSSSNSRSSKGGKAGKDLDKVFDFVETPTLLEQSRKSIKRL